MTVRNDQHFVVYKSSAGSGKTFTLVREYLKIVLQNPEDFRRILGITFTNKAANELKERVVRYLVLLSEPAKHAGSDAVVYLMPQLCSQLKMTETQVSQRALAVLRLIMHRYTEFAISTIDSFTHRVIRTFAFDLKIPMNFEVELDSDRLLAETVDLLVGQAGMDERLTRVLTEFIEKKAGDEHSWRIEKDLAAFSRTLLKEDSIEYVALLRELSLEIFIGAKSRLMGWKKSYESMIAQKAGDLLKEAGNCGLSNEAVKAKSRGILTYLNHLSRGRFEKMVPNRDTLASLESGQWLGRDASPAQQSAFNAARHFFQDRGLDLLNDITDNRERYVLARLLMVHIFSTALLGEMEKILDSLCRDNNKLLIGEFNRRISGIIRDQPAPFIYERLGEKYHHYLIDEFQDTSVLQWHNLLPLIENSLSSAMLNLVVGDAKQAIYRWRSGDAEQFEALPRLAGMKTSWVAADREQMLIREYREENLNVNHRSSPVIVGFNNQFFSTVQGWLPAPHGEIYRSVEQQASKIDKPGLVRIQPVAAEENGRSYPDVVHQQIIDTLAELRDDGYRFSDVAVLCRRNQDASRIASVLMQQGIRVISAESLLLTQSAGVNFVLAWFRHLADRSLAVPMAHILEFLRKRGTIPGDALHQLTSGETDGLAMGRQSDVARRFRVILEKHLPDFDYHGLRRSDLFTLTSYLTGYFGLAPESDSYIRFFFDAVLRFVTTAKGGLQEFLEWWELESGKCSVLIPEGIDAVRIMTIHKAKGLQFPVVIYPFADERVKPTKDGLWADMDLDIVKPLNVAYLPAQSDLEETSYHEMYRDEIARSHIDMVNLLYVAMTRPEERLYVITRPLPGNTDRYDSLPKLFSAYFRQAGKEPDLKGGFQYGDRWKKPVKDIPGNQQAEPEVSPTGKSRRLNLAFRRHAPEAWDMEEPDRNRAWGNLVHLVFSRVRVSDDVHPVLDGMLAEGLISVDQREKLESQIAEVIRFPEIAPFFSTVYEIRNEPEIIDKDGRSHRPDRVMFRDGRATVVDYKTGRPKDAHREQIGAYAGLLQQMGHPLEAAYLVYLDLPPGVIRVI